MMRRWMRWAAFGVLAGAGVWAAASGAQAGQTTQSDAKDDASQRALTVWVVRPVTAADRAVKRTQADLKAISTYQESTAGSFGSNAGDAGQTAGSYGTSASNVGRNASDVGVTAGSYGQSASSLPSDVKSQTAGSYGTTAGSIGTNASDYTGAPGNTAGRQASEQQQSEYLLKTAAWQKFVASTRGALRADTVTFLEVNGLELRTRLAKVAATEAYPDVLLLPPSDYPHLLTGGQPGDVSLERQQEIVDSVALIPVGRPFPLPVVRASDTEVRRVRTFARPFGYALGMVRAPHARATRDFLEWLDGESAEDYKDMEIDPDSPMAQPVKTALEVSEGVFSGGTAAPWADPQMAQFTLANATSLLYGFHDHVPADMHLDSGVIMAEANDRFAVVLLSSEVVSDHAYGQLYPLVVLRRTKGGTWKVLHLSLDLSQASAVAAFQLLATCVPPAESKGPEVMPVSLASPKDGEQRAAQGGLELWWDDTSNARVLLVEYQGGSRGGETLPHVFVVDDREPKLETRVSAPFGAGVGPIRWRVWSVGQGGTVRITPWQHVSLIR